MPKRRTYNFKALQGPSSPGGKPGSSKDGSQAADVSVNERLTELRKLEDADAVQKKRELAESVNQRSVPPELRRVLGVPESAPPKPKAGVRARERLRTTGPPPPKSWLGPRAVWMPTLAMRGGRWRRKPTGAVKERNRPTQLRRFAHMTGLDDEDGTEGPQSLTHHALRTAAEQWDQFEEDDLPVLVEIPLRLRLKLISYLGFYGPTIDNKALQVLLQDSGDIFYLDLAGLAGHDQVTIRRLSKLAEPQRHIADVAASGTVAASWDVEESLEDALAPSFLPSRFSQLTHLCLSHPPPTVPWRDLLAFAKHVPQLTHLSLAYWPRPTLTPNLATSTISSQHSPEVSAGASNIYSALDHDLTEPAALLRQLSNNLLCLQWLDLEGCAEWAPALRLLAADNLGAPAESDDWSAIQPTVMSIFMGSWKDLTYLNCFQGWLPSRAAVAVLPKQDAASDRRVMLNKLPESNVQLTDVGMEAEKRKAGIWLEVEGRLLHTGRRVNMIRRARGCKPVMFDYGWTQKAS